MQSCDQRRDAGHWLRPTVDHPVEVEDDEAQRWLWRSAHRPDHTGHKTIEAARARQYHAADLPGQRRASLALHLVIGGRALVTGQIPRTTPFEKGSPNQLALIDGKWQPDPWIHDDQAIIMNVKDKGLVVLTGCGHAGVVNTLKCAREMTGVNQIHAVIGGFHLTGPIFEPIIAPTIQALREFNPNIIVPQHCTGWKAMHLIAQEFPAAFIPNSVGTTMIIGG